MYEHACTHTTHNVCSVVDIDITHMHTLTIIQFNQTYEGQKKQHHTNSILFIRKRRVQRGKIKMKWDETHTSGAGNWSAVSISTPSDCVDGNDDDCGSLRAVFTSVFFVVSSNFLTNSSGVPNFLAFVFLRSFFAKKSSKSAIIGLLLLCNLSLISWRFFFSSPLTSHSPTLLILLSSVWSLCVPIIFLWSFLLLSPSVSLFLFFSVPFTHSFSSSFYTRSRYVCYESEMELSIWK